MKTLGLIKGMVLNNEGIRRYFHEDPVVTRRTLTTSLIDIIRHSPLSDSAICQVLDLLLDIAFESKVGVVQPEKATLRNGYFFGIVLVILNMLFGVSEKWQAESKRMLKCLIKTIEGSYVNCSVASNVMFLPYC